jgi:hypothetical protein
MADLILLSARRVRHGVTLLPELQEVLARAVYYIGRVQTRFRGWH